MTKQLDEEQTAEVHEICNLIGPHVTQAIADGVLSAHIALIDRYRAENVDHRHEVFERELWCKVYAASISHNPDYASSYYAEVANIAVERYNERFPK